MRERPAGRVDRARAVALCWQLEPARRMPTPRHIYSSTASRRERSWGRARRGRPAVVARAVAIGLMATGAGVAGSVLAHLSL